MKTAMMAFLAVYLLLGFVSAAVGYSYTYGSEVVTLFCGWAILDRLDKGETA